jgi:hypothetical protein
MKASIGIAIVGLVWSSTCGWAQPKERCDKRAAELFNREYSLASNTKDEFHYENHYSSRLNKCFFLEIVVSHEQETSSTIMRLFDLNVNKEYGVFVSGPTESTPVTCVVRGKHCRSENEWRQLLKPFMEN